MNKTIALLTGVAAIALTAPAFADDKATYKSETIIQQDSKGNLEKETKVEQKDAAGKTSLETETTVDVEADGDTEKTVKTEKVEDPKGLFNTKKTTTTDKVKEEDGKVVSSHKKEVNGKVVEETKDETTTR